MIEINNITKIYNQNSPNQVSALNDVSINIKKGEFLMIIGSNGSGKSTLVKMIAGTEKLNSGNITFNKIDITKKSDFKRSKLISRLFQDPLQGTSSELSILHNFRLAFLRTKSKNLIIGTGKDFRNFVKSKISILDMGLENNIDQAIGTLSGGQRQAITLLMAVLDNTELLLLDEPTAALDPLTSDFVMFLIDKIIRDLSLTAICVTHDLTYALKFGSRLIQMKNGKVLKDIQSNQKKELTNKEIYSWFEK